ncbi:peptidase M56 [Clostridium botulinum]|nr:peptidase M56 [Clostridium botulinum]
MNFFETTIVSSFIGSIIVLIILSINRIFRYKLNPTFHYYIWLILIVKLIFPFGPENSLSFSHIYQRVYIENNANENSLKVQENSIKQSQNSYSEDLKSKNSFQNSNDNKLTLKTNIPLKNQLHIEKIFVSLWILGVILLIFIFILAHKKLKQIVKTSIKKVSNEHKEILNNCINIMHIKTKVKLLYSSKISSPCLCGLVKPKILIPISLVENISTSDFKYILMHELIHLKRKDILINWIIILLSIIYWFNPIVVYGLSRIKKDCEFSCDNNAISYLNKNENIQYGNVLIKVLALCGSNNRLIGTTSMVRDNLEIKRRIIMISKYKKINFKGILLGSIIVVIIGGVAVGVNASKLNIDDAVKVQVSTLDNIDSNNTADQTLSTNANNISNDNSNSVAPFSSDIIIYNSHADEDYQSGINVTDIGALINDKLIKEGLSSNFIKCKAPKEYTESYKNSRDLIKADVKDYSSNILLDIHRDAVDSIKCDKKKITLVLAKNSPYYENNKVFAENLLKNIDSSNEIKIKIISYNRGKLCFNQDLSKNALLINLGNNMSSDSDIEKCVNVLVSALKKTQKNS